ncbi:DUF421 domain-containing protein [Nitrosomonas sp. JL21]|uniref:DUF421 domain-containing protein n=1 Tax=Nitrosomonas sp. JL21 TaxID=153949 RepID=UPI001F037459|nr:YetF domain-containing protein [Nitrosomonas sp. JL21]MXS78686.1 DUF421 domain-containing protein [Nitrosomonas sp. JL21]
MFFFPAWELLLLSVVQTATVYVFILMGLKIVGRRVFAQRGPQDLVIVALVAEASDLGLTPDEAGYWGSICSVITLLILGYFSERITVIRHFLNPDPIVLYRDGKLDRAMMRKHMVDIEDLNEVAREQGALSYQDFEGMVLEGDGNISAVKLQKHYS